MANHLEDMAGTNLLFVLSFWMLVPECVKHSILPCLCESSTPLHGVP
jgi:hypothetical protein